MLCLYPTFFLVKIAFSGLLFNINGQFTCNIGTFIRCLSFVKFPNSSLRCFRNKNLMEVFDRTAQLIIGPLSLNLGHNKR